MPPRMQKIGRALSLLTNVIKKVALLVLLWLRANKEKGFFTATKRLIKSLSEHLDQCINQYRQFCFNKNTLDQKALQSLQKHAHELHLDLPSNDEFTFSILIPVYKPSPLFLEKAVRSALVQSSPNMEILIGYDGEQPQDIYDVIRNLRREFPRKSLKEIHVDRQLSGGGISATTNAIASQATGNYFVLMDHDDWVRPDLLLRYHQTLLLTRDPRNVVLYCDEFKIDENDCIIPGTHTKKDISPKFPYIFVNFICHCLCVPRSLWDKVGGLRSQCDGAQDFDLILRLDVAGAKFVGIPLPLYAWRAHSNSTAQDESAKPWTTNAGLIAMQDYVRSKGLDWDIEPGNLKNSYRAIPKLKERPKIHAILPFKDQRELTLSAINSLLRQKDDVDLHITAISNNSSDSDLLEVIQEMGIELFVDNRGFNYSRLNNFALFKSTNRYPLLLFINNDVCLERGALLEMARWAVQPDVGCVGARLYYPNGTLQHGGIVIDWSQSRNLMPWTHREHGRPKNTSGTADVITACPAVTGACLMIERKKYLEIGGYDEVHYPIAFSDTNLNLKASLKGYKNIYTPYAEAIHYEGASRGRGNIEDFEGSVWLHQLKFQLPDGYTIFSTDLSERKGELFEKNKVEFECNLN